MIAIPLLGFIGLSFLLARFTLVPFRYAPATAVTLICVSGSLSSAFGVAWGQTVLLIVIGSIGAGLTAIGKLRTTGWHTKNQMVRSALTIPNGEAALLVGVLLVLALKLQGHTFVTWDDFSHWGVFSRDFVTSQGDWRLAYENTVYRNYPPGLSPLQYFFSASPTGFFKFEFSESNALVANSVAASAFLFPLVIMAHERSRLLTVWVGLLGLLMIFGPGNGFRTLMVDHQMAVAFGLCVVALCDQKIQSVNERYTIVGLTLAYIFLLKPSGAFLAILCLLLGLYQIVAADVSHKTRRRFWWAAILGLPSLGACLLWLSFKATLGDGAFGSSTYSSISAVSTFFSNEEPVSSIRANFLGKLMPLSIGAEKGVSFNKTAASIFLLSVWFVLFVRYAALKRIHKVTLVVLSTGLFLHAVGLLWLYVNSFSAGEALVTHSFDRYMGQFIIAPHMLAIAMFIAIAPHHMGKALRWLLGVLLTISVISFSDGKGLGFAVEKNKVLSGRAETFSLKQQMTNSSASRVMAFWDCPSGMEYLVLRYDMYPVAVKPVGFQDIACSKPGATQQRPPLAQINKSVQKEIEAGLLRDTENYLFIGRSSADLEGALRTLSNSTKNHRLYRVEYNEAKGVTLVGLELH